MLVMIRIIDAKFELDALFDGKVSVSSAYDRVVLFVTLTTDGYAFADSPLYLRILSSGQRS